MSWTALGLCFLSPAIFLIACLIVGILADLLKEFLAVIKDAKKGDTNARIVLVVIFVISFTAIGLWCLGWLK